MSWVAGTSDVTGLLELRGPLAERVRALRADAATTAPGRTAELISARAASLVHGAGVPGDVPSLESFGELTAAEQDVLAVAEQFLIDAHGIDDALLGRLNEHYDAAEQVAILFHLTLVDGFTKFARVFDVAPDLPIQPGGRARTPNEEHA